MKRLYIGITLALTSAALLSACHRGPTQNADGTISLTTATGNMASGLNAPYFVALANGYFKDQGIVPTIMEVSGETSSTSMVSGSIQLNYSGSSAANAAVQGLPVKVVASLSNVSTSLIYTVDPTVQKLSDLEGKTFGVQALGDSYQEAADLAFQAEGVDTSKVQFVPLGAGNRTTAIASGRVAAGALKKAEAQALISQGYNLRLLLDLGAQGIAQSTGGIATSNNFIASNHDALVRYLYAWLQGVRFVQAFPDKASEITLAAPEMQATAMKPDVLLDSIKQFYIDIQLADHFSIPPDAQTQLLDAKKQFLPNVKSGIAATDVYDFGPIQEAEQKLDASGWKPVEQP